MKLIPLGRGKFRNKPAKAFAAVDDADFEKVNKFNWAPFKSGKNTYASVWRGPHATRKRMMMHRFIKGFPKSDVDHRDGNGLNNQKSNLRTCTDYQNTANSRKRVDNTSGFKGVSWHKQHQKWIVKLFHKKHIHVGLFKSPIEAAIAHDAAAIEIFGAFARTNQSLGLLPCRS